MIPRIKTAKIRAIVCQASIARIEVQQSLDFGDILGQAKLPIANFEIVKIQLEIAKIEV